MKKNYINLCLAVALLLVAGCQKFDRPALGDYPKDYTVVPTTELRFFVPFDSVEPAQSQINLRFRDSISKYPSFFPNSAITVVGGVKNTAVRQGPIVYNNANDFGASSSFSVAFWEKNTVPQNEPQWLFTLPSKDYWHNTALTAFVDHQNTGSSTSEATLKVILEDQWLEFAGDNRMKKPILNNQWHHLAFVYDATTSKMTYYVDGEALSALPTSLTDVKKDGNPRGPVKFSTPVGFVIGGWTKHGGFGGAQDGWVKPWGGDLDQFRLYNKALSGTEVQALFNSKM